MRIELDQGDVIKAKAMLVGVKNGAPKVTVRAINKTMTNVRTKAVKEISKELNLTQARIRKDFTITKANYSKLTGSVYAKGKPVGLASFKGTRQTKKGVSVKIKVKGRRHILPHAFIATTKHKQPFGSIEVRNVFWRQYKGSRKPLRQGFQYGALPKSYRYKIERLSGPRIEDIYGQPEIINPVLAHANERLTHNMNQELEYELKRL